MLNGSEKGSVDVSLGHISLAGVVRATIGMPIEHPLQTIKTWMQSNNLSLRQSVRQILHKKGMKGFYSGFLVNTLRSISKQAYRWPLNIYLLSAFRKMFSGFENGYSLAGITTGLATALIQSVIICPMERVKVWLMTADRLKSYSNLYELKTYGSLWDGFQSVVLRQMISWVSFLGSQQYLKECIFKYRQKKRCEYKLSVVDLGVVSCSVSLVNTFFVMPIDYIKTHYQKYAKPPILSMLNFIADTYRLHGIKAFYLGSGARLLQYNINAFLTVPLFQKLLVSYELNSKHQA